jgi:hypothetical protein
MGSVQLVESMFRYGGHNLDDLVRYGADSVEFRQGDVFVQLDRADPVDTVPWFGFRYHTIEHRSLLRKIAYGPRNLMKIGQSQGRIGEARSGEVDVATRSLCLR